MLQTLLPSFTDHGYHVILFNSRGVGKSSGRASFSGLAEAHDLELLVHWAIKELPSVKHVVLMVCSPHLGLRIISNGLGLLSWVPHSINAP